MDLFDTLKWAEILVKTTFSGTPTLTVLKGTILRWTLPPHPLTSKNVLFIEMRQFHSLIFESVLDFHLETSYSFLIFVFRTLGKSSTY
jgi:hypothetical protein